MFRPALNTLDGQDVIELLKRGFDVNAQDSHHSLCVASTGKAGDVCHLDELALFQLSQCLWESNPLILFDDV